jgi:hypothetical protein
MMVNVAVPEVPAAEVPDKTPAVALKFTPLGRCKPTR